MVIDEQIEAVRRFGRFYTRQIDLLNEGLLRSRFPLTEARVLYELATRETVLASELSRSIGIDPGYLSRIVKAFEGDGLLARRPSPEDGRASLLSITEAGRAAFAPLDDASREQVSGLLGPLPPARRQAVVDAMATIEAALGDAAGEADIVLRRHRVGDIGWIARRQGMLYAQEYGWDDTFEALVAEIAAGFVRANDPRCERAWIAERGGQILGSVFLVRQSDEIAKLRLLYVEPDARGLGLGGRLVGACIAFAREAGYRTLTLWTNDILVSARRIYLAAGFELVEEERHHSFGQDLVGQNWSLRL